MMRERAKRMMSQPLSGVVLALVFIFIAASFLSDAFLDSYNLTIILRALAFVGLITLGQTMLLVLGELDLSLGMISGLCGVIVGILMVTYQIPPIIAIPMALFVGILCGFINGTLVAYLKLHSLVLTIGMSGVFLAFKLGLTKGAAITGIPESIYFLGQATFFDILPSFLQDFITPIQPLLLFLSAFPVPTVIMLFCLFILAFLMEKTPFGRYMYAIGNNKEAAHILGIEVNRIRLYAFMCAGFLSALAGILMVARMGTGQPSIGENWVLPAIAAAVIGGVSTTGGTGSPLGAILGATIVNIIENVIVLMGINTYWQSGVSGTVVVLAISVDALSRRFLHQNK